MGSAGSVTQKPGSIHPHRQDSRENSTNSLREPPTVKGGGGGGAEKERREGSSSAHEGREKPPPSAAGGDLSSTLTRWVTEPLLLLPLSPATPRGSPQKACKVLLKIIKNR
jgi:hypothetical protein